MAQIEYKYPNDIKAEKYKYRHVRILVLKPPKFYDIGEATSNAFEQFTKILEFKDAPSSDVGSMTSNKNTWSKVKESELEAMIVLPLPNSFTDSQSHGWSTETGIMGTMGESLMKKGVGNLASKAVSGVLGKLNKKLGNAVGNTISDLGGGISANQAIGSMASTAGFRKPIIDPGYFQNYSGSEPRQFSMAFDFIPANKEEANDIIAIIMKLKQFSSPSRMSGGVSLLSPHFFSIQFSNEYVTAMAKIDRVVLKNIQVDYGADGAMQQMFDGFPKQINVSLSWQEVDMTTQQDYSTVPGV